MSCGGIHFNFSGIRGLTAILCVTIGSLAYLIGLVATQPPSHIQATVKGRPPHTNAFTGGCEEAYRKGSKPDGGNPARGSVHESPVRP